MSRQRSPGERSSGRSTSVVLLRQVPGDSPVHRLWAGTKLLAVTALSLTLSFAPSWSSLGLVFAFVVVSGLLARIPVGALPRFPWPFWAFIAFGGFVTLLAGGQPHLHVGGSTVGLGGLDVYARFTAVGLTLVAASLMVGWTTPLGEIAPALARLGRPLRRLRVPVDEWALVVALCVRSLPLLVDELRTLVAARRLRPRPKLDKGGSGWAPLDEVADLMTAGLAVALRRAVDLAEAITARGGLVVVPSRARPPGRADVVALISTGALCCAAGALYATS